MKARQLWTQLNATKYHCPVCRFKTFNKTHFGRHLESDKHFLLTVIREEAPRDVKVVIGSFLPVCIIIRLGAVGRSALKLAWRRPLPYRHLPRVVLPHLFAPYPTVASLHARNVAEAYPIRRNGRSLAYALIV